MTAITVCPGRAVTGGSGLARPGAKYAISEVRSRIREQPLAYAHGSESEPRPSGSGGCHVTVFPNRSTKPRPAARISPMSKPALGYWSAIVLAAAAIGSYYLWQVRSAGFSFDWVHDQGGYYNYLARGFASGHLSVPITPSPELLAQPNPWDPAVNESLKMHDMALFNGRYYLYHGPGPAVLLFTPWRLITGRDMPERFAIFLLCFGGFLFSCGALIRLLALAGANLSPPLLAVMLLALGLCQSTPYLLSRVWVYEVAIAGGYFCISGALFFLVRGIESSRSSYWLGASGLMFGLAVACRPHLGLVGVIALGGLAIYLGRSRGVIAFLIAFGLAGAAVALYNYQRFGDPFEFGVRYLLSGPNQNRIKLASANLAPGLYYWLACPPEFGPVFPWVRLALRHPFNSLDYPFPPGSYIEPVAGVIFLAPFLVGALFVAWSSKVRVLLWTVLASSAAVLLFVMATGFTTQRYETDFLPAAVLVALANFGIHISSSKGLRRTILTSVFVLAIASGAVVNMALAISGPYDEMLKNRPKSYLRIAHWFSPIEQFRPTMNPAIDVAFTAEFAAQPDGVREPLLTMEHHAFQYFLYAERSAGKVKLVSRAENSTIQRELPDGDQKWAEVRAAYAPESGKLTITVNGRELLVHDIGTLVTAPAQITIGENRIASHVTIAKFTGRIYDISKTIRP
jgi:hypothetical protein